MSDPDDDMFDRFLSNNGIVRVTTEDLGDDCFTTHFWRADGSEVAWWIPGQVYGANAQLTPYTPVQGHS